MRGVDVAPKDIPNGVLQSLYDEYFKIRDLKKRGIVCFLRVWASSRDILFCVAVILIAGVTLRLNDYWSELRVDSLTLLACR